MNLPVPVAFLTEFEALVTLGTRLNAGPGLAAATDNPSAPPFTGTQGLKVLIFALANRATFVGWVR